ncbi:MAG: hypothetical protein DCF18_00605 [Cyanobium sp.]|nr:hypothetical protein [Synechococcus sp. CS-1333]PZV25138.1 MAG: hypothetical protein DCF18_00605 [Cyanobium sp.]
MLQVSCLATKVFTNRINQPRTSTTSAITPVWLPPCLQLGAVMLSYLFVGPWGWARAGQHRFHPNSTAVLLLGSILHCHDLDDPFLCCST